MKKEYLVIENDIQIEYKIIVEDNSKYILYSNDSDAWRDDMKNYMLLYIEDDGNGIKISIEDTEMRYDYEYYLYILLRFKLKYENQLNRLRFIKK